MDAGNRGSRGNKQPQPRGRPLGEKNVALDGRPEDLPPGWVRVASRSKPGAFFYAHPATKRTQVEKPAPEPKLGLERLRRHHRDLKAAKGGGSSRQSNDKVQLVEVVVEKQKEEEEAAHEEALQKARERRARAAQAEREEPQVELPDLVSVLAAARAPAGKPRRAGVRAGAENEGIAKKRRAWKKDVSEDDEGEDVTQEELERWKRENDWRETSTEDASSAASEVEPKEETECRREAVPEPEQIFEPCLDVLKTGLWVERHALIGPKQQWMLGRAVGQVDIPMQHESISRQHATVIRQGTQLFVADLGSAHGTLLDGQRLLTNTLVKLHSGTQLRFGASTRLYVFHEPQ